LRAKASSLPAVSERCARRVYPLLRQLLPSPFPRTLPLPLCALPVAGLFLLKELSSLLPV
jgi:hypothetical protein